MYDAETDRAYVGEESSSGSGSGVPFVNAKIIGDTHSVMNDSDVLNVILLDMSHEDFIELAKKSPFILNVYYYNNSESSKPFTTEAFLFGTYYDGRPITYEFRDAYHIVDFWFGDSGITYCRMVAK